MYIYTEDAIQGPVSPKQMHAVASLRLTTILRLSKTVTQNETNYRNCQATAANHGLLYMYNIEKRAQPENGEN